MSMATGQAVGAIGALAAWLLALGGCATAPNVLVVNDTGAPVQVAQITVPVGMSAAGGAERVVMTARLAAGESAGLTILPPFERGYAPRLRATPMNGGAPAWLDLPVGGWYSVHVETAAERLSLRLEERKGSTQADASERQRREIVDRPPSTFEGTGLRR